ncbi:ead/Ea22-like family protein [Enterobacter kobei]|nr:ead/Ea22-like family protein [Enterobacter kobei]
MSNIDKQTLREAAEKAGSDKWQAKKINGDFYVIRNGSYEKQHGITSYQPIAEIEHKPVRDYAAAANPATVLALLDELDRANKEIDKANSLVDELREERNFLQNLAGKRQIDLEAAEKRIAEQRGIILSARNFISEYAERGDAGAEEFVSIIDRAAGTAKGE